MAYTDVKVTKVTSGNNDDISTHFTSGYTNTPSPYGTITITPKDGFTVENDLSVKVWVSYKSDDTDCGTKYFDFTIPGSGGGGGGSISVEPVSRTWAYNETGSTNSKSFTITKSGDATVHPSRVTLTGTNPSKFHIADASESSCTVYPVETNTTTGDYNAIVVIPYSIGGVDQTPKQVSLTQFKNGGGGGDHEYVEIGGIKWATMNIGATGVTDYGLYFQWGYTQGYSSDQVGSIGGKKYFGWYDYKYSDGTSSVMTKYNSTDGLITIIPADDAASIAWGNDWRMPTKDEYTTLKNATTTAWTANYQGKIGLNGVIYTDKTDSSKVLFFPAGGEAIEGQIISKGSHVYNWTSSLYVNNINQAYSNHAISTNADILVPIRCTGCLIRPIKK